MAWETDVAPFDTAQSLWANEMRDRVVQTYATTAAANAAVAAVPEGALAYIADNPRTFVKRSGVWRYLTPTPLAATGKSTGPVGAVVQSATLTIPAGFTVAQVNYTVAVFVASADMIVKFDLYRAGATLFGTLTQPAPYNPTLFTFAYQIPVVQAGDTIYVNVAAAGGLGNLQTFADPLNHVLSAVLYPVSVFGDADPEDAYDAGDAPMLRVEVLERLVNDLNANPFEPRRGYRIGDGLRLVATLDGVPGADPDRLAAVRAALEAM